MKRVLTALVFAAVTASSQAAIINGSFEQGLTGWEATGARNDSQYLTKGTGIDNGFAAYMDAFDVFPPLATGATISTFLGIAPGALPKGGSYAGSAIKQTFSANAGDIVSFDWRFGLEASQGSSVEQAFYTLNGLPVSLLDVSLASNFFEDDFNLTKVEGSIENYRGYIGHRFVTGINTVSFQILTSGIQTLGFAELSGTEGMIDATLFVDNVRLNGEVPEPATLALFGIAGLAMFARRRKSS